MRNITPFSPQQIRDQGNHLGFRIDQKVTIFLLDLQSNVAGKSVVLEKSKTTQQIRSKDGHFGFRFTLKNKNTSSGPIAEQFYLSMMNTHEIVLEINLNCHSQ